MFAELHTFGELLILFALGTNLLYGYGFYRLATGDKSYEFLALRSYYYFTGFIVMASILLYYLFFTQNFMFKYVFDYNELSQPIEYVISAFWGGQEGTYLLWALMNAAFGFILIKKSGIYRNWGMVVFSGVNLFFLIIMIKLSPFALLDFYATDGQGLNPLLRDPWMVIHPPIMFIAYSMAAIPFCISMAAMIMNDYSQWVKRVLPWVGITCLCLAAGNILGGYWAYKTLGWGGYWGWDPVENSSFIPWMGALALLHGLLIEKRTGALRRINLMLTAYVFLLVVYGTYLTRSGVLADFSVHSFADMGTNMYLVIFMLASLSFAIGIFLWRAMGISSKPLNYNYYGKEFVLFAGMVTLFTMSVIVLFWTSLPLLTMAFAETPRAAEVATYNRFALPMAIVMALLLTMTPLCSWGRYKLENWQLKFAITTGANALVGFGLCYLLLDMTLVFAAVYTMVMTGLIMYLFNKTVIKAALPGLVAFVTAIAICLFNDVENYTYILFFATASMATAANLAHLVSYLPSQWRTASAQLSHFGFGLLLIGVLASSGFVTAEKIVVPEGGESEIFGNKISYWGMEGVITTTNNKLLLSVEDESGNVIDGKPELYYSERMQGIMRKPYIQRSLSNDLYLAPATIQQEQKAQVILGEDDIKEFDGFSLALEGFSMGSHEDATAGGLQVLTQLTVTSPDGELKITPIFEQIDDYGEVRMVGRPENFVVGGQEYNIEVEQIFADQGTVALRVGGLAGQQQGDRLVLDVSHIPLINLVWAGTTFMLMGLIVGFFRRKKEAVSPDK